MCVAMQHGKTLVWKVGLKKIRTFVGKILAPFTLLCLWCLHKPAYHHLIWQIELSKKQGALVSCVKFSSAHHHLLSEQKDGRNRNCGPDNNSKKCRPRKQAKEALPKFQFWFAMICWVCRAVSALHWLVLKVTKLNYFFDIIDLQQYSLGSLTYVRQFLILNLHHLLLNVFQTQWKKGFQSLLQAFVQNSLSSIR